MRDITLGNTIYHKFTTRAFATGIPTTLAGTPVISAYEENNLTQITAGVSITVDYDSVTGLHQVTIVATSGNGYESGKSYDLVITTGTVGGVSVVGEVIGSFTVESSSAFTRLGAPAGASVSADVADVPTVAEFNARTILAADYFDPATDTVATVTDVTTKTGYSLAATGLDAISQAATGMVEIAKAVWDRVLTGATHNIVNSAGRVLRELKKSNIIVSGTAQAATASTFTLEVGSNATDSFYDHLWIVTTGGTGADQVRSIESYVGATLVATLSAGNNWVVTPDATTTYDLVRSASTHVGDISASALALINAECDTAIADASLATSAAQTTAQNDLDIITGADGVILLSTTQASIDAIEIDTSTTLQAELDAIQAAVITNAAGVDIAADIIAVKAETTSILTDTGTTLDNHLTDIKGTSFVKDTHSLIDIEAYVDILDDATSGNAKIATDAAAILADTADIQPKIGTPAADVSADIAAVKVDTAATLVDTNELQADWTNGGRLDLLLDRLIAELDTARGEPAQGAPAASTKIGDKIDYLYKAWRNKADQTATTYSLYNDAGSVVDQKSTDSDDGTTASKGEVVAGP